MASESCSVHLPRLITDLCRLENILSPLILFFFHFSCSLLRFQNHEVLKDWLVHCTQFAWFYELLFSCYHYWLYDAYAIRSFSRPISWNPSATISCGSLWVYMTPFLIILYSFAFSVSLQVQYTHMFPLTILLINPYRNHRFQKHIYFTLITIWKEF